MSILVFEDSTAIGGESLNSALCDILADRGHDVILFDGRTPDGKQVPANQAANLLVQIPPQRAVEGLVVDLHFFDDSWYVIGVLRELQRSGFLRQGMKIVAYSRFLGGTNPNYREILRNEFQVPESQMLDRLRTNIKVVAEEFGFGVAGPPPQPTADRGWSLWYEVVPLP